MELQDQIYVFTGVFAGLIILLFVLIGYLMHQVGKISELLMGKPSEKRDTYAYNNRGIVLGEELNRRGFIMQSKPSPQSNEPTTGIPRVDPIHTVQQQQQQDFPSILNNEDVVFGGDRPSNLNQRNRGQPMPMLNRVLPPSLDYNDNVTYKNRMEGRQL